MKYEFSKGTLAIVPNENSSLVYEDDERYLIEEKPLKIMEDSCKYYGSTYHGRKDCAKEILGADYKVPIILEDYNRIIALPTASPNSNDCAWLSLHRIHHFLKVDAVNTRVVFDNGKDIILPISYRSLENQISRASRLDCIMRNRKIKED